MTSLMSSQVRFRVAGSWAIAFQKLLTNPFAGSHDVVVDSLHSGLASWYSMSQGST